MAHIVNGDYCFQPCMIIGNKQKPLLTLRHGKEVNEVTMWELCRVATNHQNPVSIAIEYEYQF